MTHRVVRAVAALALCGCAGCSTGDASPAATTAAARASASAIDLPKVADRVQKYVAQVWPRTGQIWPGMNYSDHVLLLTDGKQTWVIDKASRQQVQLESLNKNKTAVPPPGGFSMTKWKGKNAVIVRVPTPESVENLKDENGLTSPDLPAFDFELATHEQFHNYVQLGDQSWASLAKMPEANGRDEVYPLESGPRLQRAMVYNSLLAAYQHPDDRQEHLAAAAYWQKQWSTKYPEEEKNQAKIDLLEGTTQYVETMAGAMAQVKDPQNKEQIRDFLTRTLKPMKAASKGGEPYAIGAAALLNADDMGREQVKQALTTEAVTPISLVLQGIAATPQAAPRDFEKGIDESVDDQNRMLATTIEPFVKAMQDKKSWVLLLPEEAVQGSVGANSYTTKELPIGIKNDTHASFRLDSGEVTLDGATAGELKKDGKTYYAIPLNPDDKNVSLNGKKISLKGEHLTGSATVEAKTDNGQRMLYAR